MTIIVYLQSECIEKYQFELCSKYDREHDFDVILRWVVPCRKLRWICRKHSNAVVWQVETQSKLTIFVARHDSCREEVTLYHDCKRYRYCKRRIFSLTTCQLLRHVTLYCSGFVRYITKHFTHEDLWSLMFRTQQWRHSHFETAEIYLPAARSSTQKFENYWCKLWIFTRKSVRY